MTRAWVVWIVGLAATTVGVMQRTTFGASGIAAAHRFDVAPDLLASFVFLQVGVYLVMQIPAGLLLDRWGSRALITTGSVTMALGQGLLAVTTSLELVYLTPTPNGSCPRYISRSTELTVALAMSGGWSPLHRASPKPLTPSSVSTSTSMVLRRWTAPGWEKKKASPNGADRA